MPGRVGELLEARGYALDRCCPCLDHPLPADPCAYAAVVVFGGPMSANDHDCLAGIGHETEYTKRVLDCGVPYLGICLGGKVLARACGAGWGTRQVGRAAGRGRVWKVGESLVVGVSFKKNR